MGNQLYVGSLPLDPSTEVITAYFARCGEVTNVRLVEDRDTRRARAAAIVTMRTEGEARRAVAELDGTTYERQSLRVSMVRAPAYGDGRGPDDPKTPSFEQHARITQQFRELANMTYELNCAGTPLVLRIFFPRAQEPSGLWRIEARVSNDPAGTAAEASGTSRTKALHDVARSCGEHAGLHALVGVDWGAVEQALTAVRAL
jgi:RNA recognition motif-containing protein